MRSYLLMIFLLTAFMSFGQNTFDKISVEIFRKELNGHYADSDKSPLLKPDLEKFEALDFYEISEKYFIEAKFVRTPDEKPFEMPTTTSRKPLYIKYGEARFEFEGKLYSLDIFQNVAFSQKPDYENDLFLPFTDLTSGVCSYGGGRYIDLKIPERDTIYIDFNKAYNPYCAYSPNYSCPIPPPQNDLGFEVKAGVKKFK